MATEVSQLIEEYKNLANKTIDKCKSGTITLPQKIEEAKSTIQNFQPTITSYMNTLTTDVQRFVQEMAPPGEEASLYKNLMENYMWVAVCLLSASIVSTLLGPILGIFMGMVLTGSSAALLSLIIIPYLIINYIPTMEGSEEDRRMNLLVATVVDSLVMVVLLSGSRMNFFSPPVFILALGMSVLPSIAIVVVANQPRHVLLGVTIGAPTVFYLVYGLALGSLGVMYLLWLIVLGGAAVIDMQVKVGRFKEAQTANTLHQGVSIVAFLLASFVMTYISSSSTETTTAE